MRIGSAFHIATSGLRAAARRLQVSASNVANMNTDGYKASRTIDTATPDGGVETSVERVQDAGPAILRDGQLVEGSNTDLVAETVTQIQALQAYRANMTVAKTAAELLEEASRDS